MTRDANDSARRVAVWACVSALALSVVAAGCGGGDESSARRRGRRRADGTATAGGDDHGRCDTRGEDREVSEYDTSGDSVPDVRRVFRRVGDPPITRLVLVCRESDLNGDGTKDVVRYYTDDGRPLREESDRNFDGRIDTTIIFQDGHIVRSEIDSDGDERVDTKIYYDDDGHPIRTERDMAGRSTADHWAPDRWEYFENGRMVRAGSDLDGDGSVDRWDRDREYSPPPGETAIDSEAGEES